MHWLMLAPLMVLTAASPVDERRFMITGFDRIRVEGPVEVVLVPGSPSAIASGDRRAIEKVALRVDGATLIVTSNPAGNGTAPATKITVSMRDLRSIAVKAGASVRLAEMRSGRIDLTVNGAGTIDVGELSADDLGIVLTGAGTITLGGAAVRTRIFSYGTGTIAAGELRADDAVIAAESLGDLTIRARRTASISGGGTGAVTVLGDAKCRVTGSVPVTCANR